ncbi:MAG: ApaG protein [Pseudohongiellaceae bacterium]|jgi:ApaG protein
MFLEGFSECLGSASRRPYTAPVNQTPDSDCVTEGIRIRAAAEYLPRESSPEQDHFVFAYRISISNEGSSPARLVSRRWTILDSDNRQTLVEGPGVVGETPLLGAGESFEYTSACPLTTSWGTMEGSYQMERDDGAQFDAQVGRFFLSSLASGPASA